MNFALFYHSVRSDWNHGNAHFLRGMVRALNRRGHCATVYEAADGWSCTQLVRDQGPEALSRFSKEFPDIHWQTYQIESFDPDDIVPGADVVIVHEWTDPAIVEALGAYRASHGGFRLLFHDTHHRMVSDPDAMNALDLDAYDAVLAFGRVLADAYQRAGWGDMARTWHEGADVTTFYPRPAEIRQDVSWVGNWGDGERERELVDYLLEPVRRTESRLAVYGVRYPRAALRALRAAGADYRGWVCGPDAARVYSQSRITVHVPRRWYRERLHGIPTIRVFEALACGACLLSAPWHDTDGLFQPGEEFVMAFNPASMHQKLRWLLADDDARRELAWNGVRRIHAAHTCDHRARELEEILAELGMPLESGRMTA